VSALHELLTGIVDYAGLFPPAGLDLETVIRNYDRYRQSKASWMLARVIIPAAKLEQFALAFGELEPQSAWPISALVPSFDAPDGGFQKALDSIVEFNGKNKGAVVDAVEIKCPKSEHVSAIASAMPDSIRPFLEVPHQEDPTEFLQAISEAQTVFAKIRTGGVTPELIPPTDQVARFIHRCAQHDVGFKATAGLHHPIRNEFNLTYEPDSAQGTMHGFLNVFFAAAIAFTGADEAAIEGVLMSRSIDDFVITKSQIQFGDRVVTQAQIESFRKNKTISFGSCSFEEPVADLRELGFESEIQPVT
jgi:hypothetical protein